jgi:hypothetical protein
MPAIPPEFLALGVRLSLFQLRPGAAASAPAHTSNVPLKCLRGTS